MVHLHGLKLYFRYSLHLGRFEEIWVHFHAVSCSLNNKSPSPVQVTVQITWFSLRPSGLVREINIRILAREKGHQFQCLQKTPLQSCKVLFTQKLTWKTWSCTQWSQRRKQKFERGVKLIIKTASVLYIEARKIDITETWPSFNIMLLYQIHRLLIREYYDFSNIFSNQILNLHTHPANGRK